MNNTKISCDEAISQYGKRIAEERRKLEEFSHDKRQETERKLAEANEQYKKTEERRQTASQELGTATEEVQRVRTNHDQMREQIEGVKREIDRVNAQLQHIAQRERNKLAPFGRNMEHVLADIARAQWFGGPPVGPLGQYVRVRDPRWAPLLRVRIGQLMSAFAVTDARDRPTLDAILKRHGKYALCFCQT